MKIYSEKTGKEYPNVELCLAAEKEYDDKIAAEQKAKEEKALALKKQEEQLANERKADAEKVESARKAMGEATKAYNKAMNDFLKRWGSYHKTYKFEGPAAQEAWNDWMNNFWDFWF